LANKKLPGFLLLTPGFMLSASDNLEIHAFDEVLALFCKCGARCRGGATELSLAASVTTTDAAPCTDRIRIGGYAGDEQDYRAQRRYWRNNGFNGYGQHALTGIEPMTPRRCILVGEHEGDWQKFLSDD
jgi:hypothetical protein